VAGQFQGSTRRICGLEVEILGGHRVRRKIKSGEAGDRCKSESGESTQQPREMGKKERAASERESREQIGAGRESGGRDK